MYMFIYYTCVIMCIYIYVYPKHVPSLLDESHQFAPPCSPMHQFKVVLPTPLFSARHGKMKDTGKTMVMRKLYETMGTNYGNMVYITFIHILWTPEITGLQIPSSG